MLAIITVMKNGLLEYQGANQTMIKMDLVDLMYFGEFITVPVAINFLLGGWLGTRLLLAPSATCPDTQTCECGPLS